MAISANGYIARTNNETPWSEDENTNYKNKVKEVGNLVLGKTTYDLMMKESAFNDLNNPLIIVLTKSMEKPSRENTYFVSSFNNALKVLITNGYHTALIGGGGQCDTAALKSGKINEIFLDIEPHVFGSGIPLFVSSTKDLKLKLIEFKKIGTSGIQLHYRVKK